MKPTPKRLEDDSSGVTLALLGVPRVQLGHRSCCWLMVGTKVVQTGIGMIIAPNKSAYFVENNYLQALLYTPTRKAALFERNPGNDMCC